MSRFKKILLFCFILNLSSVWTPQLNSMAITIVLHQVAQLSRVLAAMMQQINIINHHSIAQKMLLEYSAQTKLATIPQPNMPIPDLHLMCLPPLNVTTHQIQSVCQDQMLFMTQLSQKAHTAIEQAQIPKATVHTVHSIINKPTITLADLKGPSIVQLLTQDIIKGQKLLLEKYHQSLATKFGNEHAWTSVSLPGSLKYVSPNGKAFVEFRAATQNSQAAYFDMQQMYKHSLREMQSAMQTNAEYESLIKMQVKAAIETMGKLNSDKAHERILAIECLTKLHISGPPDFYLQKTIDTLLKGYIQSDGTIPASALLEKSNYPQKFIKQFINTIAQDLSNFLPIKQWALSVDLHNMLGAHTFPIGRAHNMGHGAREFLHLAYDHKSLLLNNTLHQARLECIQKSQAYDFALVEQLIKSHGNDPVMQKIHQYFLQEFNQKIALQLQKVTDYKNALFNQQGFYQACEENPWFILTPAEKKQSIASSPAQLELYNQNLLAQLAIKNELMLRWNIPQTVPKSIHQMVYLCIGNQAQNLHSPIAMVDAISQLAQSNAQTLELFFMPNGLFKDFAETTRAKTLPVRPELFAAQNKKLLQSLNYLVHIESGAPKTAIGRIAQDALNKYEKLKTIQNVSNDFQIALNDIVFEKMEEHDVYDYEKLSKKLTPKAAPLIENSFEIDLTQTFKLVQEASLHACSPVEASSITEAVICPSKEEKQPEVQCGTNKDNKTSGTHPKEACKVVGNEHKDATEHTKTKADEKTEEWQCNHSKHSLPSFNGEVITPENVPIIIAPDEALKDITPQETEAVKQAAQEIEKVIQENGDKWIQDSHFQKDIEKYIDEYNKRLENLKCKAHDEIIIYNDKHLNVPDSFKEIITNPLDWEKLSKVFDGTILTPAECGDQKSVWFDYQHILGPIIIIDCKTGNIKGLHGFHHDYLGKIKKSGLIKYKNLAQHADGFWQAHWKFGNSRYKFSGFFPDHWTPSQVMAKVIEAMKDIKDIQLQQNGKYELTGYTNDKIKITIILQYNPYMKSAKIISAYPNFNP
jgi:hypothetical protein